MPQLPEYRRKRQWSPSGVQLILIIVGFLLFWQVAMLVLPFWAFWRGAKAARHVKRDPNGGTFWFFFWW